MSIKPTETKSAPLRGQRKRIILICALIVFALGLGLIFYFAFGPKPGETESAKKGEPAPLSPVIPRTSPLPPLPPSDRAKTALQMALNSSDLSTSKYAAMMISKSSSPDLLKMIIPMLKDNDYEKRLWASVALARLGQEDGLEILKDAGEHKFGELRLSAMAGLLALGDPEGLNLLQELLSDPENLTRAQAARTAGEVGCNSEEIRQLLIPLLNDPSDHVRVAVAGALLRLGDPRGKSILYDALQSPDSAIQYAGAFPLADVRDPAPLPFLQKQYDNYDITVKAHVAPALYKLGDSRGISALEEGLMSEDLDTRVFSAISLTELSSQVKLSLRCNLKP